jgi:hypothetical protein
LRQKHYRDAFGRLQESGRVRTNGTGGIARAPLLFV